MVEFNVSLITLTITDTMTDTAKSETHAHVTHDESAIDEKNASSMQPQAIAATFDAIGGAPSPWGHGHLQLYGACILIYLCSTMNGTC
jgi:hypothetical protein